MYDTLILGADGFVGRALLEGLAVNCKGINGVVARDSLKLLNVLNDKPKIIINCCGNFSGQVDIDLNANVGVTLRLLDSVKKIRETDPEFMPIVYLIGSAAEYGAADGKVGEDHLFKPNSVYGITKCLQYRLAELYREQGFIINYLRLFNLYGNGMSKRLLIGRLFNLINENKPLNFGSLSQTRDYLHINEFTQIVNSLINKNYKNITVNIGSGEAILVRDFIKKILNQEGINNYKIVEDMHVDVKSNGTFVCDVSLLRKLLG